MKNGKSFTKIGIVIVGLLLTFIIAINASSTFAYYAYKVPGIKNLVALTLIDKAGISTSDGKYGQLINKSIFKKNVKFTVNEIVSTDNETVFMCTVKWFGKIEGIPYILNYKFKDEYNNDISINGGSNFNYDDKTKTSIGIIRLDKKNSFSSKIKLIITTVNLPENKTIHDNWEISVFIDKEKSKEKQVRVPINKVIKTEDGSIKITDIGYSLSETEVYFQTKGHIKNFGGIDLVNSDGYKSRIIKNNLTNGKGSWRFETLYPNKAKRILITSIEEEFICSTPIDLNTNDIYPKDVVAENYKLRINSVNIYDKYIEVEIKSAKPLNEENIDLKLIDNFSEISGYSGTKIIDNFGEVSGYSAGEMMATSSRIFEDYFNVDNLTYERSLVFKKGKSDDTRYKLKLTKILVFKNIKDEIVIPKH